LTGLLRGRYISGWQHSVNLRGNRCYHRQPTDGRTDCAVRATCNSSPRSGVTLKCLPRKQSARGITELICLPLIKLSPAPYKFSHYRIAPPPEKSPPADNLPVKLCPAQAAAGRGGYLPVNCRPEETFLGGVGNPITRHRQRIVRRDLGQNDEGQKLRRRRKHPLRRRMTTTTTKEYLLESRWSRGKSVLH